LDALKLLRFSENHRSLHENNQKKPPTLVVLILYLSDKILIEWLNQCSGGVYHFELTDLKVKAFHSRKSGFRKAKVFTRRFLSE